MDTAKASKIQEDAREKIRSVRGCVKRDAPKATLIYHAKLTDVANNGMDVMDTDDKRSIWDTFSAPLKKIQTLGLAH